jgi:hypothetical protein
MRWRHKSRQNRFDWPDDWRRYPNALATENASFVGCGEVLALWPIQAFG